LDGGSFLSSTTVSQHPTDIPRGVL
jgi:hypothetical protein